jgi:hypothetical protein
MEENTKKELNNVKYFYINKANKIRRITSQLMNQINKDKDLSHIIYTKEIHKIQQLDATFELLDEQLQDLKKTIKYYKEQHKNNNENDLYNKKEKRKNNNLFKSDLDLLFPIMYLHLNSGL